MPLTATAVRNAKPSDKQYKLTDGEGMYLLVKSAGRYWRLDFRFQGKRKTLAIGVYPDVSLKQARERRDEARRLLADGIDPMVHRKATRGELYAPGFVETFPGFVEACLPPIHAVNNELA